MNATVLHTTSSPKESKDTSFNSCGISFDPNSTALPSTFASGESRDSSCHTSECSFEMDSVNEEESRKLCSIDELFSVPPSVQQLDKNGKGIDTFDDKNINSFDGHLYQLPLEFQPTFSHQNGMEQDNDVVDDEHDSNPQCSVVDFPKFPVKYAPTKRKTLQSDTSKDPLLCWSCQKNLPKYKCPQCSRKTCSLECVKFHKEKLRCDGERVKTEYVAKEDFTETHFLSDYRFLEEVNRRVSQRHHLPRPHYKNKSMSILLGKAQSMNIYLKLLPPLFKRRKENSTYYCFKNRQFLWHVEWVFDSCFVTIYERRLPDSVTLRESVNKFINAAKDNSHYDPRLHDYSEKEFNFYMKKEKTPANETMYYQLDASQSLRNNLKRKIVIEYPRIYVVFADRAYKFEQSVCKEP